MKKIILFGLVLAVLVGVGWRIKDRADAPASSSTPQSTQTASFNKNKLSTSTPGSLWWVVNKSRPLPNVYIPSDLTIPDVPLRLSAGSEEMKVSRIIAVPLQQLVAAAKKAGLDIMLVSGYRSFQLQQAVYNQNVRQLGQAAADTVSAKPGTSEHQTGLVADLGPKSRKCELEVCFADTPEGTWLAEHAHEYGFIIRYPEGKEAVTGYSFEPWHFRFVGTELAAELRRSGTATLEEFFNL